MQYNQVLLRSHLQIHKSLASAGEDFFLFCDPPVTPAFAFLLTDAAAAIGGLGTDAVTIGESAVSHAARLAALAQALQPTLLLRRRSPPPSPPIH